MTKLSIAGCAVISIFSAAALFIADDTAQTNNTDSSISISNNPDTIPETKKEMTTVNIIIETSLGSMKAELYQDKAPVTVANFLDYADSGYYSDTIFHRVIPNFMIQGGGFTEDMQQKTTKAAIKNEAQNGLKNDRGTLAMARTMVMDSATSQFFINHKDNDFLNFKAPNKNGFGYAVFGKLTDGYDVLDKIAKVKTHTHPAGLENVPAEPVKIISIKRAAE